MKYKIGNFSETFCCVCVHVCRCVVARVCTYIRRSPYILRQGLSNPELADWASLASQPASGISSQVLGFQAGPHPRSVSLGPGLLSSQVHTLAWMHLTYLAFPCPHWDTLIIYSKYQSFR